MVLPNTRVSDGVWHNVTVTRLGYNYIWFKLQVVPKIWYHVTAIERDIISKLSFIALIFGGEFSLKQL